ncbi:MAG: NAD(P)-dependent oxidoreductase [Anaerovoracaceae bacterium]
MQSCARRGIGYDSILKRYPDHTMALVLALMRHKDYDSCRNGIWDIKVYIVDGYPAMRRISTQTLGIFGFGKIAKLVAKKARGFGFRIIATDPYVSQKEADEYGVELVDFDTVLRESDIMTINMPLTAETKHKFNLETFKKMKKTAAVVNTGRGPLIKEDDLYVALKERIISAAAIDVTEEARS